MKAAIITDIHFGSRGDSPIFLDAIERFLKEDFFPYLDQNGIKILFNLGDTFDKRTSIKYETWIRSKTIFFDEIAKRGIDYHCIIGNHDTPYKDTNYPNSVQELVQPNYPKFNIITEPEVQTYGNTTIQWIPWIPMDKETAERYHAEIENSQADILFGHFEIIGSIMQRGSVCEHGLDPKTLKKFEIVGSGHFHHRSVKENIWYFGSPYQFTWADHGNQKGFHVIDLDTRDIEFIPNKRDAYFSMDYDEDKVPSFTREQVEGVFVKVNVVKLEQQTRFEAFVTKLDSFDPHRVDVIDKRDYGDKQEVKIEDVKDTKKIIADVVAVLDIDDARKIEMNELFEELYKEATALKL